MDIIDQVNLCTLLMERLNEAVKNRHHECLCGREYDFDRVVGAGKYQIKADITRLRRELQKLSEVVMK